MKTRRFTYAQITGILFGIIMQIACFVPWIPMNGRKYFTFEYLIYVWLYGQPMEEFTQTVGNLMSPEQIEQGLFLFTIMAFVMGFMQLLQLFQIVLVAKKKEILWTSLISIGYFAFTTQVIGFTFGGNLGALFGLYPTILSAIVLADVLIVKCMEEWDQASKAYKEMRVRDAEFRKERKRRLHFPGKYSKLFYQSMWKNFWHGRKQYALFVAAGTMVSGLSFVSIGVRKMFLEGYGEDYGLIGLGISSILQNFIIIVIGLSVLLITLIFVTYLKNRITDYGLLQLLGIRQKTLNRIYAAELIACYVFAVLLGMVSGNVVILVLRPILRHILPETGTLPLPDGSVYIGAIAITFLVYLLSLAVSWDIYLELNAVNTKDAQQKKERMPGKFLYLFLGMGITLTCYSIYRLTERRTAESMLMLCLLFLGLYFTLPQAWALMIRRTKKYSEKYFKRMLSRHMLLHKFKTSTRYFLVLAMIHIGVMFYFTLQIVTTQMAEPADEVIPYDYMCLANESDEELFETLKTECDAQIVEFPMVRATTVDNNEGLEDFRTVMEPQGQNIGISESTYYELKKLAGEEYAELNLSVDGKNIYIVYQQDKGSKAVPIDWYMDRQTPYVHIGQPVLFYDWPERKVIFEPREIVGEEVSILTGAYRQGRYENLIVFSDEYFAEAYKTCVEGPKQLILMDVPEELSEKAETILEVFKENHILDESFDYLVQSVYEKEEIVTQRKMERTMTILVNVFIIFMLTMIGIFLLHIKSQAEVAEMERRYAFMECFGMRKSERVKYQKQEISRFIELPFFITIIAVPILTFITLRIRGFYIADMISYVGRAAIIWGIYAGIHVLNMKLIQHNMVKRIEG